MAQGGMDDRGYYVQFKSKISAILEIHKCF